MSSSSTVDEHRGSSFVATKYQRLMNFFGTENPIETGKIYQTENGRRVFSPISVNSFCLAFSPSAIKSASDFIFDSFALAESDVGFVFFASFMADFLPFLLFALFVLVLIDFIYPEKENYPSQDGRSSRIVYLMPLAFSFSLLAFYMIGKQILMPAMFFPQTDTNGLAISFVINACIIMTASFVCRKRTALAGFSLQLLEKAEWLESSKRLLFFIATLFIVSRLKVFLTGSPVSFFYTSFSVFTLRKFIAFFIYAAVFLTFFYSSSLFLRLYAAGKGKRPVYHYYYMAGSLLVLVPYAFLGQLGFLSAAGFSSFLSLRKPITGFRRGSMV